MNQRSKENFAIEIAEEAIERVEFKDVIEYFSESGVTENEAHDIYDIIRLRVTVDVNDA